MAIIKKKSSFTLSDKCLEQLETIQLLFSAAGKRTSISGTIELLTSAYLAEHAADVERLQQFTQTMQLTLFDDDTK